MLVRIRAGSGRVPQRGSPAPSETGEEMQRIIEILILFCLLLLPACSQERYESSYPVPSGDVTKPCSEEQTFQETIEITSITIGNEFQSGQEQGGVIIVAIEQFQNDKGRFPDSLNELLPKYLCQLPDTITGQKYSYQLLQPSEFNSWSSYLLSFEISKKVNTGCTYLSGLSQWECGPQNVP
jgi:hypothetical protein